MRADLTAVVRKAGDSGSSGRDSRLLIEAALWIVRTNSPWRTLSEGSATGSPSIRAFGAGRRKESRSAFFKVPYDDPDFKSTRQYPCPGLTSMAPAQEGDLNQAIDSSRGGDQQNPLAISFASSACPASVTAASASRYSCSGFPRTFETEDSDSVYARPPVRRICFRRPV